MNIERIEEIRNRKKLSQRELAEIIGITTTGYQKLIRTGDLKVSTLQKISVALGVNISVFLTEKSYSEVNEPGVKYNTKADNCKEVKDQLDFYKNLYEQTQKTCAALTQALELVTNKKAKAKV